MDINDYKVKDLKKGDKILLGMSGGVDSSVSAYILQQQGFEVIGISLKMFDLPDSYFDDAKNVAEKLGIKWHLVDCQKNFKKTIINYFLETYQKGETPNPCAKCNKYGKFTYLFHEMVKYDCTRIATGHYAKTALLNGYSHISYDDNNPKDQSYYLSLLPEKFIQLLLFPLGSYEKADTRQLAKEIQLSVADKAESQDACFLMGADYRDFIKTQNVDNKAGYFIFNGEKLKKHEGIMNYTIGQRKGLDIGGLKEPLFVKQILPDGDIILADKKDSLVNGIKIKKLNTVSVLKNYSSIDVKFRYRMKLVGAKIELLPDDNAIILFDKPQFSPAPGQIAALYSDDVLLGGGFITWVI